jgi:DtxR family Mn-dependent transcriptional regulator
MSPRIDNLPDGSSTQRNSLTHQAIEDYLKTIYALAEEEEGPVSTSRIAEARDVKPASVTNMMQRLASLNLVSYEKHSGVTLTESGRQIALEVLRHHRLIELYLMEALGFRWDEVHEQADILEHVISEKLEERIAAALNHPTVDPHGDPIPARDGTMETLEVQALSTLSEGQKGRVARIIDDANSEMLRYLAKLGLTPGTSFEVLNTEPFDGPLTLLLDDDETVIGHKVAGSILVEPIE